MNKKKIGIIGSGAAGITSMATRSEYEIILFEQEHELGGHEHNLWIAGFYTTDVDSHNSAIISAIYIAKKLAPKSKQLAQLIS